MQEGDVITRRVGRESASRCGGSGKSKEWRKRRGWRTHCCLGRALAFFYHPALPGEMHQEERAGRRGAHMEQAAAPPASIPLGTVATVARCGHQVQISGIREGFSSGN